MFVLKASPQGTIVWMEEISATRYCYASSIATNNLGEVFVCGNYLGEIQGDDFTLKSGNRKQGFLIKLGQDGEALWGNNLNASFQSTHMHLATSHAGDVYFGGSFTGKLVMGGVNFDSKYYSDIVVARYDNKGTLTCSKMLSGAGHDYINDLTTDAGGELILTGSFEKKLVVDKNKLLSKGQKDMFVVEMDENLRPITVEQFGGIYNDAGREIAIDASGNMYLSGTFTGRVEFDKFNRLESLGTSDVFLLKFGSDGHCVWSTSFGGPGSDYVSGLEINIRGDVYLVGTFRGNISANELTVLSESFANDAFLAKYNASGQCRFIENFGGESHDFGKTIGIDASNNIYVGGNFSGQLNFLEDRTIYAENEDIFISRLHDCEAAPGVRLPADTVVCGTDFMITVNDEYESYFWNGIAGKNEFIADSSGPVILEAIDKYGCNTFDTMNLILNKPPEIELPDTIRVQQGETITLYAPAGMEQYLWSDQSTLSYLDINTTVLPTGATTYWLTVINENGCLAYDEVCLKVTAFKDFTAVDIAEQKDDTDLGFEVSVFPNPAKENITIDINGLYPGSIIKAELFTQEGDLLIKKMHEVNKKHLRMVFIINTLPPGIYLLCLTSEDIVVNKKVVVL